MNKIIFYMIYILSYYIKTLIKYKIYKSANNN